MRYPTVLIAVFAGSLAWSSPALAANGGSVVTVELTKKGAAFEASSPIPSFTLAGVHWRGSGDVRFRTRSVDGVWSPWRAGAPEAEDGPDPLSSEPSRAGWRIGNPYWVGESNRIEARVSGRVQQVRARLVWSPALRIPYRRLTATETPAIVPRATWGADESIRRGAPAYAQSVRFAVVHHTAGRNDYTRAEAPAVVRGIQLYHVQGNGWNDIGYNFLVDRFGTVYEGRFGGIDRNVIGAHAMGFNTGSVGIALLGTYGTTKPSAAALDALERLIAWRLDLAHVDPGGSLSFVSGGSERYASGTPVQLSSVSGHRDTGYTECPGDELYARLPSIAAAARAAGGQKVFDPLVETAGTSVRFRARLLQPGAWSVGVADSGGVEVARGTGSGTTVDWTWDSSTAAVQTYTWSITAGSARPATGSLRAGGASAVLGITDTVAEPSAITPNGDGQADSSVVTYRLSKPASVTVGITDAFGAPVTTVLDRAWTRAGKNEVAIPGAGLADGSYTVSIAASTPSGEAAQAAVPLIVSRTLGLVTVSPVAFSPNGDGRNDELAVTFSLTAPAAVRVRVERDGRGVVSLLATSLPLGEHRVAWNGTRPSGAVRDGRFEAVVEVQDAVGTVSFRTPFVVDTTAPRVRFVPGRGIRLDVSEPASLTVRIDGQALQQEVTRAGVVRIPWSGIARRVRVVARDPAGNTSPPLVWIRPKGRESGQ